MPHLTCNSTFSSDDDDIGCDGSFLFVIIMLSRIVGLSMRVMYPGFK